MCTKAPSFDLPLKHQAQDQGVGPQRMLAGEEEEEEEEGGRERQMERHREMLADLTTAVNSPPLPGYTVRKSLLRACVQETT